MMKRQDHDPYRLMRYVAISAADGIAAGWTCVLALIWFDVGGIGTLVHNDREPLVWLFVLLMSFGTSFGFLGIAWRVMFLLPDEE